MISNIKIKSLEAEQSYLRDTIDNKLEDVYQEIEIFLQLLQTDELNFQKLERQYLNILSVNAELEEERWFIENQLYKINLVRKKITELSKLLDKVKYEQQIISL
jgi:hypothetical protein